MTLARAEEAAAKLRAALVPIDPAELGVRLEHVLALWPAPENFAAVAGFYRQALERYPRDIAAAAIDHVAMTHAFPTMPKPADFHRVADRDYTDRYRAANRADMAIAKLRAQVRRPPAAPERLPAADARADDAVHVGDIAGRLASRARRAASEGDQ
jgi:hypothetical protein